MTFDEAYELDIGTAIAVSNGASEPLPPESTRWRCWRGSNFSGVITAKSATPRTITIEDGDVAPPLKSRAYTLASGDAHTFTLV